MTTPNAAEEFMQSLDQHPEIEQELRRRLLTQELLDLPNTVGKLATAISEMREIFDRRLTSLESQQSENTEQLNSIQQTLNTLDGRVANITGSDYERRATRRVSSLLSRYLRLSRIQALHSPLQETAPFLVGMINNALTAHDITNSEADDLEQADIIVSANNAAGDRTYLVAEASVTIDDTDIDRAHRRAQILQSFAGRPVIPAVIGATASDANRQRATDANVHILTLQP